MTERIEAALAYIPADDRNVWVMAAMGVKQELGEEGFDIWDRWSQQAKSYSASAAQSVWKSCRGGSVSIGSVFHEAKANGWRDDDKHARPSREQLQARQDAMQERLTADGLARAKAQQGAAKKAAWILNQTLNQQHAYLQSKGWPDAKGPVWWPTETSNLLCIPMRVGRNLVGLQLIDREGGKRFLTGQRTSEAVYCIDNSGRGARDFFLEGYSTGISLRECLQAMKMRYRIHITFSASNLVKVAALNGAGLVIADNDKSLTGERAAIQTGLPYFMSDVQGEDFNDLHKRLGTLRASQVLRNWLVSEEVIANGIAEGSQKDRKRIAISH